MWYTVIARDMSSLADLHGLMHDINSISRDWSVWADMVTFHRDRIILVCRYSGSTCYDAGRTELDRMLSEKWGANASIDDDASRAVNRVDGVRV